MSDRKAKERIDYKKYHNTGDKVRVSGTTPSAVSNSTQKAQSKRKIKSEDHQQSSSKNTQPNLEVDKTAQVEPAASKATIPVPEQDEITKLCSSFQSFPLESQFNSDSSGELKTDIQPTRNKTEAMAEPDVLAAEQATLAEDITDFIEENPTKEIGDFAEDYDQIQRRLEDLRSQYRNKHNQLKQILKEGYKDQYEISYTELTESVKNYIKDLKSKRKLLRITTNVETKNTAEMRETKFKFLENEVTNAIQSFTTIFTIESQVWKSESDVLISRRKNQFPEQLTGLKTLSESLQAMMDAGAGVEDAQVTVSAKKKAYEKVITLKDLYKKNLDEEVKSRELEELKEFNKAQLGLKMPKFSGYKSNKDIYTFKSEFEKLHRTIAPSMLPDILKNRCLENPALLLVKDVQDIEDIWKRLIDAYGGCKIMLQKKLSQIDGMERLSKLKDPEKIVHDLSKIINLMKDLMNLAKQHNIEEWLYHGNASEKLHWLLGEDRFRRWITQSCEMTFTSEEAKWLQLISFLEKEIKVCQHIMASSAKTDSRRRDGDRDRSDRDRANDRDRNRDRDHNRNRDRNGERDRNSRDRENSSHHTGEGDQLNQTCFICGETDHVATSGPRGTKLIQYFSCKKFIEMSCAERFEELKRKNLCWQCLYPGARKDHGKHREGHCQREYACKHESHDRYNRKLHVLVCEEHKQDQRNKEIFEEYKRRCINRQNQTPLPEFATQLQLNHVVIYQNDTEHEEADEDVDQDVQHEAIYILQRIKVEDKKYNLFYDNGCRQFCSRYDAVTRIGNRATEIAPGPRSLGGVGGMRMDTPYGLYKVKLPRKDGGVAVFSGACLEAITETFPSYPLAEIKKDIDIAFAAENGNVSKLPTLVPEVGGDTDFMIGAKYLKHFSTLVFKLPSGLCIYESQFLNEDGSTGVIGGPHPIIEMIDKRFYGHQMQNFLSSQYHIYETGLQINPDIKLLGYKTDENIGLNLK